MAWVARNRFDGNYEDDWSINSFSLGRLLAYNSFSALYKAKVMCTLMYPELNSSSWYWRGSVLFFGSPRMALGLGHRWSSSCGEALMRVIRSDTTWMMLQGLPLQFSYVFSRILYEYKTSKLSSSSSIDRFAPKENLTQRKNIQIILTIQ